MFIMNFGSLNIDHIYRVNHIVMPGETIADQSLTFAPGGKGLNQSIALARSGVRTMHAGCVGTDGGFLRELMEKCGVQTEYLRSVENLNGHAVIQVNDDGQNSIIIHGGSNRDITREQVDETLAHVSPDDMVLLQNETSQVSYIAECCGQKNIPLAFNPSPFSEYLLKKFPFEYVTYLLINETEGQQLSGYIEPEDIAGCLISRFPDMKVVLTLGSKGVYYADRNQVIQQPSFQVEAVDTTGAGDTFTGFFLGMISQGLEIPEALRYACAAAAISVTREGAAPSVPDLKTVKEFLNQYKNVN